jgi:hypothetical protein
MKLKTDVKPATGENAADFSCMVRWLRIFCLIGSFALAVNLTVSCATKQPTAETQDILLGSGFKVVTPSTPEQQALLKKLRPGKFAVVNRKGKTWYVFPDLAHNQAYVGNAGQYQSFQQSYQDEQLTNDETQQVNLAKDSAEWDAWNALGVWGGPN